MFVYALNMTKLVLISFHLNHDTDPGMVRVDWQVELCAQQMLSLPWSAEKIGRYRHALLYVPALTAPTGAALVC